MPEMLFRGLRDFCPFGFLRLDFGRALRVLRNRPQKRRVDVSKVTKVFVQITPDLALFLVEFVQTLVTLSLTETIQKEL